MGEEEQGPTTPCLHLISDEQEQLQVLETIKSMAL